MFLIFLGFIFTVVTFTSFNPIIFDRFDPVSSIFLISPTLNNCSALIILAGSIFLSVPSAFTETTGKRHWHSLLKARAIENFSYVFAPAQGGTHYNGRKTFGHSMIISPDGKILKELNKSEGVITALIDEKLPKKLRTIIPSLKID